MQALITQSEPLIRDHVGPLHSESINEHVGAFHGGRPVELEKNGESFDGSMKVILHYFELLVEGGFDFG